MNSLNARQQFLSRRVFEHGSDSSPYNEMVICNQDANRLFLAHDAHFILQQLFGRAYQLQETP
jgi:hypothetical protein